MMDRRHVLRGAVAAAAGALLPTSARAADAPAPRLGIRRAGERGHANHGWLDTWHSFSFARYYDRRWMGFRSLRVINEDRVEPGRGFPMHPHDNMEIVTYVLSGSLEHKDTLGNGSVIVPGEVQYMSAGTGIRHSEFNPSREDPVHLLQIWIQPDERGAKPRYGQKTFPVAQRRNTLRLVASKSGKDDSIAIRQDANLLAGILDPDRQLRWRNPKGRHVWLHVARGELRVGDHELAAGDAVWTTDPGDLEIQGAGRGAELLLFDLA